MKSRYYNPMWCRWLNADSVNYLNLIDINGTNLYQYCSNNPVIYVDPDGNWDWGSFWRIIGAVVVGAVSSAIGFVKGGIPGAVFGAVVGGIVGAVAGTEICAIAESEYYVNHNNIEAMSYEEYNKISNSDKDIGLSRDEKLSYIRAYRIYNINYSSNWSEAEMLREMEFHERGYALFAWQGDNNGFAYHFKKTDFEPEQVFMTYFIRGIGNLFFW